MNDPWTNDDVQLLAARVNEHVAWPEKLSATRKVAVCERAAAAALERAYGDIADWRGEKAGR